MEKTFAIFHYLPTSFSLESNDQLAFIGYRSGNQGSYNLESLYSNINNPNAIPVDIAKETGNTSKSQKYSFLLKIKINVFYLIIF